MTALVQLITVAMLQVSLAQIMTRTTGNEHKFACYII